MRTIKVVVLLVQQLQHGFTKNAKVSPNLTVAHLQFATCGKMRLSPSSWVNGWIYSTSLMSFCVVGEYRVIQCFGLSVRFLPETVSTPLTISS